MARATLAIAPIIGPPHNVVQQLNSSMSQSLERQQIAVGDPRATRVNYTLRGYIVAARDRSAVKVSYIFDVTDGADKRLKRITGERQAAPTTSKDPWTAVTPAIVQSIAETVATDIGRWLPTQAPATPVAAVGTPQPASVRPGQPATLPPPARTAALQPPPATTTGSIPAAVTAVVVPVRGAPGDGNAALAAALQRELSQGGVTLARARAPGAYMVQGIVAMGKATNGRQSIKIEWRVKDPAGKSLGTVSQKNDIAQGSLDGAWGKTADAAASAAAQGILKLIPGPKATN
ncbi:MAG: hypothetical protein R3D31_16605 [Hyphomicrobiaceae bacterium]